MYQGTLNINPIGAKLKRDTDFFSKMDPYLKVTVGGETFKTKVHKNGGKNPIWQNSFSFNLMGRADMVHITCFDKDVFTNDDFIGETSIPIQQLHAKKKVKNGSL